MTQFGEPYNMQPVPVQKSGKGQLILKVVLIAISVISITLAVWALVGYLDQKNNVDSKISNAVTEAVKTQADEDEAKFAERENEPSREFVGPEDYGRLSFSYSKNWSLYVADDAANGGTYEAYLNPVSVPPITSSQKFALRLTIEEKSYDSVVSDYDSMVEDGDLTSSDIKINGVAGKRYEGAIDDDISGALVVFKIRDKTLTMQTDSMTFESDFDAIVQTIKFNQ